MMDVLRSHVLRSRQWTPRRTGQSLVEATLVLPLLSVLLMAIIEFGWVFYGYASLNSASRIGARIGSTGKTQQEITNAVNSATGLLKDVTIATSVETPVGGSVSSSDRTTGNLLTVKVSMPYNALTKLVDLGQIAGLTTLTARSTFVICY